MEDDPRQREWMRKAEQRRVRKTVAFHRVTEWPIVALLQQRLEVTYTELVKKGISLLAESEGLQFPLPTDDSSNPQSTPGEGG